MHGNLAISTICDCHVSPCRKRSPAKGALVSKRGRRKGATSKNVRKRQKMSKVFRHSSTISKNVKNHQKVSKSFSTVFARHHFSGLLWGPLIWQKSGEKGDKSIRRSDQKVTERVPITKEVIELRLPTSFCGTLKFPPQTPGPRDHAISETICIRPAESLAIWLWQCQLASHCDSTVVVR